VQGKVMALLQTSLILYMQSKKTTRNVYKIF
jgi:hypothetical protein